MIQKETNYYWAKYKWMSAYYESKKINTDRCAKRVIVPSSSAYWRSKIWVSKQPIETDAFLHYDNSICLRCSRKWSLAQLRLWIHILQLLWRWRSWRLTLQKYDLNIYVSKYACLHNICLLACQVLVVPVTKKNEQRCDLNWRFVADCFAPAAISQVFSCFGIIWDEPRRRCWLLGWQVLLNMDPKSIETQTRTAASLLHTALENMKKTHNDLTNESLASDKFNLSTARSSEYGIDAKPRRSLN